MIKQSMEIFIWILSLALIGFVLSLITQHNYQWYHSLNKSILTPPSFVFSIVWPILYAMIAIAGWSLWTERHKPKMTLAFNLYAAQLILNWAWTPIFFQFHLIVAGYFVIVAMIVLTLAVIFLARKKNKLAVLMLTPYCIWLIFAAYLNGVIWTLN